MNLNNEDRELLINNYLEKARTTIKKVEFLVDNNEYQLAVNRIYYLGTRLDSYLEPQYTIHEDHEFL